MFNGVSGLNQNAYGACSTAGGSGARGPGYQSPGSGPRAGAGARGRGLGDPRGQAWIFLQGPGPGARGGT